MNHNKIILITNVPAPYRAKQYDIIGKSLGKKFFILYTQSDFSTTKLTWDRPQLEHQHYFLNENRSSNIKIAVRLFYFLKENDPEIVITSGFNLLMSTSFIYSKLFKKKHIVFTDSWLQPVNQLSWLNRIIRLIVIKNSVGFICVGKKGREYLIKYGANSNQIFISRLADEINYIAKPFEEKEFDLVYCGQIIDRKQPLFFVEVANEISQHYPALRLLIIGTGPKETEMIERLKNYNIDFKFVGFVTPKLLKEFYNKAKILLFPTLSDPWGMVANDALSLGIPVITTPNAGCADDLVVDNYNGFIVKLDKDLWKEKILLLLKNSDKYKIFSENSLESIKEFTLEKAASDFIYAINEISNYNGIKL